MSHGSLAGHAALGAQLLASWARPARVLTASCSVATTTPHNNPKQTTPNKQHQQTTTNNKNTTKPKKTNKQKTKLKKHVERLRVEILENLRHLAHAPGVQFSEVPPDAMLGQYELDEAEGGGEGGGLVERVGKYAREHLMIKGEDGYGGDDDDHHHNYY